MKTLHRSENTWRDNIEVHDKFSQPVKRIVAVYSEGGEIVIAVGVDSGTKLVQTSKQYYTKEATRNLIKALIEELQDGKES